VMVRDDFDVLIKMNYFDKFEYKNSTIII